MVGSWVQGFSSWTHGPVVTCLEVERSGVGIFASKETKWNLTW